MTESFLDVDECQSNATNDCTCDSGLDAMGCISQCANIISSYTCSCSTGFMLTSDQRTCIGK